jgi:hypothetical protein
LVAKSNIIILEYIAYPNRQVRWNKFEKFQFYENGKVLKSLVYYSIEEEKNILTQNCFMNSSKKRLTQNLASGFRIMFFSNLLLILLNFSFLIINIYLENSSAKRRKKLRIICQSENQEKFQIIVEVVFFLIIEIFNFNSSGNYYNFLLFIL